MSLRNILRLPTRTCFYAVPSIPRRTLATTPSNLANINSSNASSTAAKLQSQVTKQRNAQDAAAPNKQDATTQTNTQLDPAEQSQLDREANYTDQADRVGTKMATEPENVTKEDANQMHSKEHKAFGNTEPGGIASQAQSLAAENTGNRKA